MQDAERGEDRLVLAVLRHQADAERDRVGRRCRRDRLAVERDRAGGDAVGAEDGARKLGAAGADEAGDAEDLAGLEIEVDAFEHDGVRRLGIAHRAQAAHGEPHVAGDLALRRPRIELGRGAADHLLDDLRQLDRPALSRSRWPASLPSRSTVMRSQMAEASSSRCVTNMIATPSLRSRSMIDSSRCTSVSVSAEVGSSMMMSRLSSDSARAISTSCCSATDSAETGVSGSMVRPTRAMMSRDVLAPSGASRPGRAGRSARGR